MPVVDAWMQHPTLRHSNHEMFESLRRWTGMKVLEEEMPVEATLSALAAADVDTGLSSAWYGPQGALITNDEVAGFVARSKGQAARGRGRRPHPSRRGGQGTAAGRRGVGLRGPADHSVAVATAAHRPALLPPVHRLRRTRRPLLHPGRPHRTAAPSETGLPIPYIDQVALDFPELTIVCGHIGYPWTTEMIAVADKHANVYIDTSAYTTRRYPRSWSGICAAGDGARSSSAPTTR